MGGTMRWRGMGKWREGGWDANGGVNHEQLYSRVGYLGYRPWFIFQPSQCWNQHPTSSLNISRLHSPEADAGESPTAPSAGPHHSHPSPLAPEADTDVRAPVVSQALRAAKRPPSLEVPQATGRGKERTSQFMLTTPAFDEGGG